MSGPVTRGLPAVADGFATEDAVALAEGLDHVNDAHPDTVLLVVQALAGRPDAHSAEVVAVATDSLTVRVGAPDGSAAEVPVPFAPAETSQEVFAALMGLVGTARAAVGETRPLTSLETDAADTLTMTTVPVTVRGVRRLSPNLLEVTLTGLAPLRRRGGDEYCVLMPDPPAEVLRPGFTAGDLGGLTLAEAPRAAYTLRARRPDTGEGDLWVVLHGDEGRVSSRIAVAEPGSTVAAWGTRRSHRPPDGVLVHLLVCDETALGAVASVLDGLPPGRRAVVVAETVDRDHEIALPARPEVDVRWVHRGPVAPGTGGALLDGVRSVVESDVLGDRDGLFVFGAGEAARMRELRTYLRRDVGLDRGRVRLTGYWSRSGH